jgi:hypothetical protein
MGSIHWLTIRFISSVVDGPKSESQEPKLLAVRS